MGFVTTMCRITKLNLEKKRHRKEERVVVKEGIVKFQAWLKIPGFHCKVVLRNAHASHSQKPQPLNSFICDLSVLIDTTGRLKVRLVGREVRTELE